MRFIFMSLLILFLCLLDFFVGSITKELYHINLKKKLIKNVNVIGKLICCGLFHMKRPKFKGQEQWTKY